MEENFIEQAKKQGLVKDVKEAFKEYPTEEEWHKGNIDYYIKERMTQFSYNIGDIVFVPKFKYESNESGKNHLFVIIDEDNSAVSLEYFGLLISSNIKKLSFSQNILLEKDNQNNLLKDSLVKTDYVYRLEKDMLVYKIGEVSIEKVNYYKECVKRNFLNIQDKDEYIKNEQTLLDQEYTLLEKLSQIRKNKKLSQRDLAKLIGIKQPMLAKIEKGKNSPQLNTLLNILNSLGYEIVLQKKT